MNEMDQIACPSTDIMTTLGRTSIAMSAIKCLDANDPDAGTKVDSMTPLGCSPAKAKSEVKRVKPIAHKIFCIA